ncbi:hypothetical protein ES703_64551 [subsurface metagenome]
MVISSTEQLCSIFISSITTCPSPLRRSFEVMIRAKLGLFTIPKSGISKENVLKFGSSISSEILRELL